VVAASGPRKGYHYCQWRGVEGVLYEDGLVLDVGEFEEATVRTSVFEDVSLRLWVGWVAALRAWEGDRWAWCDGWVR
jgi:hypothetical protein